MGVGVGGGGGGGNMGGRREEGGVCVGGGGGSCRKRDAFPQAVLLPAFTEHSAAILFRTYCEIFDVN